MNLIKCENNHYYNADKFPYCPHCINAQGIAAADIPSDQKDVSTEEVFSSLSADEPLFEKLTVGWLMCLNGSSRGQSFPIFNIANHIGRNSNMDVILKNEKTISREDHAVIEYDNENNSFSIIPGDSTNPTMVNNSVITKKTSLKDRDMLILGECQLMFVILCDDNFSW